jgi:MFS family permease
MKVEESRDAEIRVGALWFQPGITGGNFATLCYASFSTIAIITFLGFAQPYLLTEVLHIPLEEQGTFTGLLATFSEIMLLALSGVVGATSDRVGRRLMFVGGFVCIALGYFIYPLADTKLQLILFRCVLAIGFATAPIMLSACIVDYIQERSRGRWLGTNAVFTGLGAMFMAFVLAKLPQWYLEQGASAINAGRYTFWTTSALCLLSAIILWFGLSDRRASTSSPRNIMQQTAAGFREGWANPRLALAYAAAFIGRGDLVIISTFLSLWVVQTGVENGISAGEALAKAGILYGILQGSALLWAYGMGIIADRVNSNRRPGDRAGVRHRWLQPHGADR